MRRKARERERNNQLLRVVVVVVVVVQTTRGLFCSNSLTKMPIRTRESNPWKTFRILSSSVARALSSPRFFLSLERERVLLLLLLLLFAIGRKKTRAAAFRGIQTTPPTPPIFGRENEREFLSRFSRLFVCFFLFCFFSFSLSSTLFTFFFVREKPQKTQHRPKIMVRSLSLLYAQRLYSQE